MKFAQEQRAFNFQPNSLVCTENWPAFATSDVFLRSQNFLEPGPAYEGGDFIEEEADLLKELIEEHSDYASDGESPNEIEYLFDQCAKRDFVVRRGRNNRVMTRTIDKNVFNDNFWWGHEQDVFAKGKDIVYEEYRMKKNGRIMSK